ncbi:unnamed protein product [Cochlearia groenlandica]
MYESYLQRSYLEENNALMIKRCPTQGCNYVIEFCRASDIVEYGLNVVRLGGHTFCWRCSLESHTPMTCNNASDWLCAFQVSTEEAKSDLRAFEEDITKKPSSLQERSIRLMREGLMMIVQSRQVLKRSCVYDDLHTDYELSNRENLRFLQEYSTSLLQSFSETLKEQTAKVFSENPSFLSRKISTLSTKTSDIGNSFYHFGKAVEDGLSDVKVRSYDNVAGPYWFYDRCTYKNTWFHKECKMCCCDGLALLLTS